jgi:Icc-related predicted phosphoesterase
VIYSDVPDDVEILLTHTPAFGILDKTRQGKEAGCSLLASTLSRLHECRLHVFGHIHESHGAALVPYGVEAQYSIVSVNAAMERGGQAIIVDLKH